MEIKPGMTCKEVRHILIERTLKHTKGNKSLAAFMLGISRAKLYRILENEFNRKWVGPEYRKGKRMLPSQYFIDS